MLLQLQKLFLPLHQQTTTDMKTTINTNLDNFIYTAVLINPIKDITSKLSGNNFRDCDVAWLNNKLVKFTEFAAQTLGHKITLPETVIGGVLNDYTKSRFIEAFTALLKYFESID